MCEESITAIPGVEKVVNNLTVPPPPPAPAPVTITADDPLTKGVNDAIKDYPGVTAAVKDGVSLVFNKLKNTLVSKGLKAMESIWQELNPDLHEALTEIPAPGKEGKVIDEMQKGYYLNDKLIRHARVVVGK